MSSPGLRKFTTWKERSNSRRLAVCNYSHSWDSRIVVVFPQLPLSVVDVLWKMALNCGLLFVFAIVPFAFVSAANKRTLVLLDNWTIRETHSIFFRTLRGKTIMHLWLVEVLGVDVGLR